jgi:hypothetical protein
MIWTGQWPLSLRDNFNRPFFLLRILDTGYYLLTNTIFSAQDTGHKYTGHIPFSHYRMQTVLPGKRPEYSYSNGTL